MFISLGESVCDRSHGFFPEIWTSCGLLGADGVYLVTVPACDRYGLLDTSPTCLLSQIDRLQFVLIAGEEGSFGIVLDHFHISCLIFISYV